MSLNEKITEAWAHSKAARQVWIRENVVALDPAPTYSRLDHIGGLR